MGGGKTSGKKPSSCMVLSLSFQEFFVFFLILELFQRVLVGFGMVFGGFLVVKRCWDFWKEMVLKDINVFVSVFCFFFLTCF